MDKQLYSANDPSTSCTNMVNFGPVTPEIEVWEIFTFETIWQKVAYLTEYLNKYWTNLHHCLSLGRCMYGDYTTDISFVLVQGMLLWQPINFGGFLQMSLKLTDCLCATRWMPPDYWQTDNSNGLVMVIRNYNWLNSVSRVLILTCCTPLVQMRE